MSRLEQPVLFIEASSLGQMVDLLHKEILRLEDEQSTLALRMLARKTRWKREAKEAGHRQKEETRRDECNYVYTVVSKLFYVILFIFLIDKIFYNNI